MSKLHSATFGKLEEKAELRSDQPSVVYQDQLSTLSISTSYLFHDSGDCRPHLLVNILGVSLPGLLDSGSSRTILGRDGWSSLQSLGLRIRSYGILNVSVADGRECHVEGIVEIPMELNGVMALVDVLVVPGVKPLLVLGIDFWQKMRIVPDLAAGIWQFSSVPITSFSLTTMPAITSSDSLSSEERLQLDNLISSYFERMGTRLGRTTLVEHVIDTGSASPIKQRYYPVSPAVQEQIDRELDKMIEDDVVEPSTSAWSSPIILVKKPDGTRRFVVDFRKVNSVTRKDAYPLPYVTQILDRLRDARFISSVDIKSAYWQVPLEKNSRDKTAFTVPGRGLFQFKCMPMGMHNSPATWQRLIDAVLRPDLEPFIFVYLDDVIIVTQTFQQHVHVLDKVFTRLIDAGLTVNQAKCEFCRPELKYLGYVIDSRGLRVDPDKVQAILDIQTPSDVKQVRSFVGVASWYRRFIPDFASRINVLTRMQRKNYVFEWTEEADAAFKDIRGQLIAAPILSCPNFDLPFQVQTDASGVGLGAVLFQLVGDEEKVVAYASRSLTQAERKFSATELECLAVLWTVEKWRPYLEGRKFTVHTDHASLLWLHNLKDPHGRLARWALRLQQYDFNVVHRKGRENIVADFLSRIPGDETVTMIDFPPLVTDPWYCDLKRKVQNQPDQWPEYKVENDLLFKYVRDNSDVIEPETEWKLAVPQECRKDALYECHDAPTAAHAGGYKTCARLALKYFWPTMRMDVSEYIRQCKVCQQVKVEQQGPVGRMGTERTTDGPWTRICTDLMGPFPRSSKGNKYLLVVSDTFTKFTLLFPLRSAKSQCVCSRLEENVFLLFGVPKFVVCDNGPEYIAEIFRTLSAKYGVVIHYNARRHPQANPTERTNRVIISMLRSYITDNQALWDKFLPEIGCALRTATSEVTGFTPYFLNFGREMTLCAADHASRMLQPATEAEQAQHLRVLPPIWMEVQRRLHVAHERNAKHYNLRRRPVEFFLGDRVWKKNFQLSDASKNFSAKLAPRFAGPFTVSKKVSPVTYHLKDDDGRPSGVWHVSDLKPYYN
jgi:RNase H-like domain found in reverse transcriptase/Reverse transcriptase (RNA-dependent DNA polymerase)/Integrase zinc binding domain/Integrase core domain